jgi:hypothetical protein
MSTVLILRVADGRDFFVSLLGTFLRSAYGQALDTLLGLGPAPVLDTDALGAAEQEAVRAAMAAARSSGGGGAELLGEVDGSGAAAAAGARGSDGGSLEGQVPKEVLRLVTWLEVRQAGVWEGGLERPWGYVESGSAVRGGAPPQAHACVQV